jgi:hypothetical protein
LFDLDRLQGQMPGVTGGKWGGTDGMDQQKLRGSGRQAGKPVA